MTRRILAQMQPLPPMPPTLSPRAVGSIPAPAPAPVVPQPPVELAGSDLPLVGSLDYTVSALTNAAITTDDRRLEEAAYLKPLPDYTPRTVRQAAPYIALGAWFCARTTIMGVQQPYLLVDITAAGPMASARPPRGESNLGQWRDKVTANLDTLELEHDDPRFKGLLSPLVHKLFPRWEMLCLLELEMLDRITAMATRGISSSKILSRLYHQWGLPLFFAGEALQLASYAAEQSTAMLNYGTVVAGMQSDIEEATKQSDVRARIAARKSLAQATGALNNSEKSPAQDAIDILKEVANLAHQKRVEAPTPPTPEPPQ